jgi:transcriptional regulator NrdR family protein
MKCACGSTRWSVTDSRAFHTYIIRRRKCLKCGVRITTYEVSEEDYQRAKTRDIDRTVARLRRLAAEINLELGDDSEDHRAHTGVSVPEAAGTTGAA